MKIEKDMTVTLSLRISAPNGQLIMDGKQPFAYLHGGYGNLFPKLEAALEGRGAGAKLTLDLEAEDAYGLRDRSLEVVITKREFPPGVKVGGQLERRAPNGQMQLFDVVKIKGDQVFLDGNHPFSGIAVRITATVLKMRPATAEEIEHGHAHGDHGHHH